VLLNRTDDHPEAMPPSLEPVSLADAISELIPQISYLPERAAPLHRLRDVIAACGGLLRLTYRESATLVPAMRGLLDRPVGPAAAPTGETQRVPAPAPGPGQIAQSGVQDAIDDDDCVIVLSRGMIRVLDGIAPTIWHEARRPRSREDVVEAVIRAHGSPPDGTASARVNAAIDELLVVGLLTEGDRG
jgi:hypothetical protein